MERRSKKRECELLYGSDGALISENKVLLEMDTGCGGSLDLLRQLQSRVPAIGACQTWREIARFIRPNTTDDTLRERILAATLQLHRRHRDQQSAQVLVLLMWQVLVRSHRVGWSWDRDGEDLWQNTMLQFLRVLAECDPPCSRVSHLTRVFHKTVGRVRKQYQRAWRLAAAERAMLNAMNANQFVVHHAGFNCVDDEDELQHGLALLHRGVESGLIRETDRDLILTAGQSGISLRNLSKKIGISYDAAKKRRQRAGKRLREFSN